MPNLDINNVASLVEGVANQLEAALKSTTLAKSQTLRKDGEQPPMGGSPPPDASAGPSGPPDAPPADPSADPGAQPDPNDPGEAQATPEQLQAEFEAMPPEQLQIWAQAINAALAKVMGGAPGADGPGAPDMPPAPDASAGGPPPGAPPAGGPPPGGPPDDGMGKGEDDGNGHDPKEGTGMSKAQFEAIMGRLAKAEEATAKIADLTTKLQKSEDEKAKMASDSAKVAEGVTKLLKTVPLRKTVSGVSAPAAQAALKKSQNSTTGLTPASSRNEIFPHVQRITKESRTDLSKSEREELNKWTANRATPPDRVIQILDAHPPL